jgi:hypothetical protein
MKKSLPGHFSDFQEVVISGQYFVDKSMIIEEIIN